MIKPQLLKLMRSLEELENVDLESETQLVTRGLLDSYAILVLVTQIEKTFGVSLEVKGDLKQNFDSLTKIESLIQHSHKPSVKAN